MTRVKIPSPRRDINPNGRPWTIPRFNWTLRITPETEHVINLMTLHFGISKNAVCTHAVHKLWEDVAPTIDAQTMATYEKKVAAARMYRLAKSEVAANKARKEREQVVKQTAQREKLTYRK